MQPSPLRSRRTAGRTPQPHPHHRGSRAPGLPEGPSCNSSPSSPSPVNPSSPALWGCGRPQRAGGRSCRAVRGRGTAQTQGRRAQVPSCTASSRRVPQPSSPPAGPAAAQERVASSWKSSPGGPPALGNFPTGPPRLSLRGQGGDRRAGPAAPRPAAVAGVTSRLRARELPAREGLRTRQRRGRPWSAGPAAATRWRRPTPRRASGPRRPGGGRGPPPYLRAPGRAQAPPPGSLIRQRSEPTWHRPGDSGLQRPGPAAGPGSVAQEPRAAGPAETGDGRERAVSAPGPPPPRQRQPFPAAATTGKQARASFPCGQNCENSHSPYL